MKVFKVIATISGEGEEKVTREERIVAFGWPDLHKLLEGACRDTGCMITEMNIKETGERPFDCQSIRTL